MLKKTTVYLSDNELLLLNKMAAIHNITVAEAIRQSIQMNCRPRGAKEKSVWDALDKIWAKTSNIDPEKIEKATNKALKEVRNVKKVRSGS